MFEEVIICHELGDEEDDILLCADEIDNSTENALVKECDDSKEENLVGMIENEFYC